MFTVATHLVILVTTDEGTGNPTLLMKNCRYTSSQERAETLYQEALVKCRTEGHVGVQLLTVNKEYRNAVGEERTPGQARY